MSNTWMKRGMEPRKWAILERKSIPVLTYKGEGVQKAWKCAYEIYEWYLIKFGMWNKLGHVVIILDISLFQIGESNSDLQLAEKKIEIL